MSVTFVNIWHSFVREIASFMMEKVGHGNLVKCLRKNTHDILFWQAQTQLLDISEACIFIPKMCISLINMMLGWIEMD